MSTNIQELYVKNVRPLPDEERRQLAALILAELPEPVTANSAGQDEIISQTPIALAERETKRQKSIAWIKAHRAEYGGKYVALDGDELVAVGQRYGEARKMAVQKGYLNVFVGDVLPLDYEGFMGGWE